MEKKLKIYHLLSLVVLLTLFACHQKEEKSFAELLERQGPISTTSEWFNTRKAIQTLQNDIRKQPGNSKNKLLLALAYMQEARVTGNHPYYYPAASKLLDEVLDKNPTDINIKYEATVAKATVQLSLHQFDKALISGKQALAINPTNASVYGVLCDAHLELGHYNEAVVMVDKMVEIRPDIRSYSRISYLREIFGNTDGAIEAMREAVASGFPGSEQKAWARYTLGHLLESKGDLQAAENQYKIATAELPDYAFAVAALGKIEAKKQNYSEAIKLLNKASKTIPEFSFLEELVRIYINTGEKSKAEETTEELLKSLEEDQAAGHIVDLELAKIQMEFVGDLDKALEYGMKEYKKRPDNIDVCKMLADIYFKRNENEKAQKFLERATRTGKYKASSFTYLNKKNGELGLVY